jgi:hypothetical protein
VFARPATPACIPAGYASTPKEAFELLEKAGLPSLPFAAEIKLGGLNLKLEEGRF